MLSSAGNRSDYSPDRIATIDGVELRLRSYQAPDRDEIFRLYHHGLLIGTPDPRDPAADLHQIEEAYLKRPQDHFWVAELNGRIVGSIAVKEDDGQIAHVRRLRVDPAWQSRHGDAVARALIYKATQHARQFDCLKLVLHTPVNDERAIALLHELGFEYARSRELGGRHLLEFYIDLYVRAERFVTGGQDFA